MSQFVFPGVIPATTELTQPMANLIWTAEYVQSEARAWVAQSGGRASRRAEWSGTSRNKVTELLQGFCN